MHLRYCGTGVLNSAMGIGTYCCLIPVVAYTERGDATYILSLLLRERKNTQGCCKQGAVVYAFAMINLASFYRTVEATLLREQGDDPVLIVEYIQQPPKESSTMMVPILSI